MTSREKIIDDITQMASGAVGLASGMAAQIREDMKLRAEEMASRLDLVPRADFERLEAVVQQLRLEQETLKKELAALKPKKKATPAKKAAPKKKTTRSKK